MAEAMPTVRVWDEVRAMVDRGRDGWPRVYSIAGPRGYRLNGVHPAFAARGNRSRAGTLVRPAYATRSPKMSDSTTIIGLILFLWIVLAPILGLAVLSGRRTAI